VKGPLTVQTDTLLRSFDSTQLELKRDGIVEGLIVPWMSPSDVVEDVPGVGVVQYREQFARGAFARAEKAPNRVLLTFTHDESFPNVMGYGRAYRDSAEGAILEWKLYEATRDKAEDVLRESHTGLSVTFRSIRPLYGQTEREGALVTREAVHLSSVAATDRPVYAEARVLALRAQQEELQAQQEAERERIARQLEGLAFLQARGRELTPAQAAYLQQHRHLIGASA